jgi:hypothetical protein
MKLEVDMAHESGHVVYGIQYRKAGATMKYRHYKGGIYEIVCEALLESDPNVTMVIYKAEEGLIWARPKDVFF